MPRQWNWVTDEPVYLTIVGENAVLIERQNRPGAVVVSCTEEGDVMINGRINESYDERWIKLVDLILVNSTVDMIGNYTLPASYQRGVQ